MGVETALLIATVGSSVLGAVSSISSANKEAKAVARQGELQSQEKAKEVKLRAARQQASFLSSGLTLEGTPMSAIQSTFSTGIEDVNQIISNANTQSKNIVSNARMSAISNIAQTALTAGAGAGMFEGSGLFGAQGGVSRTLEFGSSSGIGPIQNFGGF